jgi:hypothetical protein
MDALKVPFRQFQPGEFGETVGSGPFSMCFSGGGAVSCATATGIYRALYPKGLLDASTFACMSSNSGGAWPMVALFLENTDGSTPDLDTVLAPIYDADLSSFSLALASQPVSDQSILLAASKAPLQDRLFQFLLACPKNRFDQFWSLALGDTCLKSLGLYSETKRCLLVTEHDAKIDDDRFITVRARPSLPLPITVTTVISYSGILQNYDTNVIDCSPYSIGFYHQPRSTTEHGLELGGRVNTCAFNAVSVDHNEASLDPTYAIGADAMCGLTSNAAAVAISQHSIVLNPLMQYTPHLRQTAGPSNKLATFVDGGVVDNAGIFCLLARGQKNIIMVLNADKSLSVGENRELCSMFGLFKNPPYQFVNYAEDTQVFPSDMYQPTLDGLRTSMQNYTRTGILTLYDVPVLENVKYGIPPQTLDTLTIVYPETDEGFLNAIPTDTRTALLEENKSFPHYPAIVPDPDHLFDLVQLSTIGSNGAARYAQYVCDTYIIPRIHLLREQQISFH